MFVVALELILLLTYLWFPPLITKVTDTTNQNISQSNSQITPRPSTEQRTQSSREEGGIIREDGRKRFLNANTFFQINNGRFTADKDGFKLLLTSYLLDNDSKIRQLYNNDKDRLWNKMLELNPNEFKRFIESNQSISIDSNNPSQKKVFDNLLIYSE